MRSCPRVALVAAFALCASVYGSPTTQSHSSNTLLSNSASGSEALRGVSAGSIDQDTAHRKELTPESRLLLVRYVDGEFAKAVVPLPRGKKGLKIVVGKPVDLKALKDTVRLAGGPAANPGETVQITKIEFRDREIAIEINGGPKRHYHLSDHLQVGMGGYPDPPPQNSHPNEGMGATIIVDYRRPIPDMSPDDLKHDLSVILDFSKQHSATVNWVESLPPEFEQAIKDNKAIVGMDHDMVIAALGRPEKKVRERTPEGDETEDWIYGTPPGKTIFVTFLGDKVIRVKEFN
jgi:hypothetical protein